MAIETVLLDASVLYPAPLRDLLMHLALLEVFRARWTDQIHEEWIRSLLRHRPDLRRAQLERTRRLMNAHVMDCLVTGYEAGIEALHLPDPDDRHVLAAAIHAGAGTVLTFNLAHFPADRLGLYGIEAQHPDAFLVRLFDAAPAAVCLGAARHRATLRNPPKTVEEYLDALARQRLPQIVGRLRDSVGAL